MMFCTGELGPFEQAFAKAEKAKIIVKKKAPKKCPKSKVTFESGLRSHGKVKGFEDQLRRPDREGTAS